MLQNLDSSDKSSETSISVPTINTYGLTELGYKIFLDRYAYKDMTRKSLAVGDTVIAILSNDRDMAGKREVSVVTGIEGDNITVVTVHGETHILNKNLVDKPTETNPSQLQSRVAQGISEVEKSDKKKSEWKSNFEWLMQDWKFVPGGRILAMAGTGQDLTAFNCFVLPLPKDSREGIFDSVGDMAEIMSRGGGVGVNVSSLRPRYSYVKGVNGRSSGSVSWADLYSVVTGKIEQGGSRRGALLVGLADWHPDIEQFIHSKRDMKSITNANISVLISSDFMEAVKNDADWTLRFPDTAHPEYNSKWTGDIRDWEKLGYPVNVYKTLKAKDLWYQIIESAWASAEPGLLFIDRANELSNSYYYQEGKLVTTNPCTTGDTLVSTKEGYVKARDLKIGMEIPTLTGWKKIEKVYNNGLQKIFKVSFSDGDYLECTSDHKLRVVRDGKYEWVAVKDLFIDDTVLVTPNTGGFAPSKRLPEKAIKHIVRRNLNVSDYYDRNLGFLAGAVIGDGTLRQMPSRGSYSYQCAMAFGLKETDWENLFYDNLRNIGIKYNRVVNSKDVMLKGGVAVKHSSIRTDCYMLATLMANIGVPVNTKGPNKYIPEILMNNGEDFLAGLIDGLFYTDGNVNLSTKVPHLRFTTSSLTLARQVRMILLQFGIHGRIYTSERNADLEYDGRSMYGNGLKYDVYIMNKNIETFMQKIGFSNPYKAKRAKEVVENHHFVGETWTTRVLSVEDTGREEEVFDLYEPEHLTWITNGYTSFDCGEQFLAANSVCNLGSLNLAKFYDAEKSDVNWDMLGKASEYGVRFLDNVIDQSFYFMEANEKQQKGERRVGLGVMGLAELLILCKVRYGSLDGITLTEKIMKHIAIHAYKASSDIAKEKGSFKFFDADKFISSGFMNQMPDDIKQKIKKDGIRNVTLLSVQPTGTTGTMINTSTGIEPFFSWIFYRQGRLGWHEERVQIVRDWLNSNGYTDDDLKNENISLPSYFVTAMELTPEEHVDMQAAVQKWVDASISKTANVPNEYTIEETSRLYTRLYESGCKGGTIYRDGSRNEQVLHLKKDETKENVVSEKVEETPESTNFVYDFDMIKAGYQLWWQNGFKELPDIESVQNFLKENSVKIDTNSEAHQFDEDINLMKDLFNWVKTVREDGIKDGKSSVKLEPPAPKLTIARRPDILTGKTFRTSSPTGTAYITVNEDENGYPFEMFVTIGKAGSDIHGQAEALGRLVSLSLQMIEPVLRFDAFKKLISQMSNIGGSRSYGMGPNRVLSLQDAIAQSIQKNYIDKWSPQSSRTITPSPDTITPSSSSRYTISVDTDTVSNKINRQQISDQFEDISKALRNNMTQYAEGSMTSRPLQLIHEGGDKNIYLNHTFEPSLTSITSPSGAIHQYTWDVPNGYVERGHNGSGHAHVETPVATGFKLGTTADICPECGNLSLIRSEGCQKCELCGHAEC